jgi:hypothetical protein
MLRIIQLCDALTAALMLVLPARADLYSDVPEAGEYDLLYSLDVGATANYNATGVSYQVNRMAATLGRRRLDRSPTTGVIA